MTSSVTSLLRPKVPTALSRYEAHARDLYLGRTTSPATGTGFVSVILDSVDQIPNFSASRKINPQMTRPIGMVNSASAGVRHAWPLLPASGCFQHMQTILHLEKAAVKHRKFRRSYRNKAATIIILHHLL